MKNLTMYLPGFSHRLGGRRALPAAKKTLGQSAALDGLAALVGRFVPAGVFATGEEQRDRVFTPWVTFVAFLGQVLTRGSACRETVRRVQAWCVVDKRAGRRQYLNYLAWLAEDEPARKQQRFETMSRGWIIGSEEFAKAMVREQQELVGHGRRLAAKLKETREAMWQEELASLLSRLDRTSGDLVRDRKSAPWKAALAAAMKTRTTATNRWLGERLHMGGLHEVSRQAGAWQRKPDPVLQKKLRLTTNCKA